MRANSHLSWKGRLQIKLRLRQRSRFLFFKLSQLLLSVYSCQPIVFLTPIHLKLNFVPDLIFIPPLIATSWWIWPFLLWLWSPAAPLSVAVVEWIQLFFKFCVVHSLVFVAKHHPDDAHTNAEGRQQQHADLRPLVQVRQVVLRDPFFPKHRSDVSTFSQRNTVTVKHEMQLKSVFISINLQIIMLTMYHLVYKHKKKGCTEETGNNCSIHIAEKNI